MSRRKLDELSKMCPAAKGDGIPTYAGEDARAIIGAGKEIQFERLHIHLREHRHELWCIVIPKTPGTGNVYVKFGIIYTVFFWSLPEVMLLLDAKEIYVEKGVFAVESWIGNKAGRVVIKPR